MRERETGAGLEILSISLCLKLIVTIRASVR